MAPVEARLDDELGRALEELDTTLEQSEVDVPGPSVATMSSIGTEEEGGYPKKIQATCKVADCRDGNNNKVEITH